MSCSGIIINITSSSQYLQSYYQSHAGGEINAILTLLCFICTQTTESQINLSRQFLLPGIPVSYLYLIPKGQMSIKNRVKE